MTGRHWAERRTPIGKVVIVDGVNSVTFIAIIGGKPLTGKSYGLTPAKAREVAAALTEAAAEVEAAGVSTGAAA